MIATQELTTRTLLMRAKDQNSEVRNAREQEENYLNLWSYLRRRYPKTDLESKSFEDLVLLKNRLEGPRMLRQNNGDLASVRRR